MRVETLIVLALSCACAAPDAGDDDSDGSMPPAPTPVVDPFAWRAATQDEDVFGSGALPPECVAGTGYFVEPLGPDLVIEIDTGLCDPITLVQPTLVELAEGDTIEVRLWHYDLVAPEPGNGWTAVAIDGETVWEYATPIPAESHLASGRLTIAHDIAAGASVQFHVRNHGLNRWDLISIVRDPP